MKDKPQKPTREDYASMPYSELKLKHDRWIQSISPVRRWFFHTQVIVKHWYKMRTNEGYRQFVHYQESMMQLLATEAIDNAILNGDGSDG